MDATNTNKTTVVTLVVLLLGAAFTGIVPTVQATHTGDIDVVMRATGGRIAPDLQYDITLLNIAALTTGFDAVALYMPNEDGDYEIAECDVDGDTVLEDCVVPQADFATVDSSGTDNDVTMADVTTDADGLWRLIQVDSGDYSDLRPDPASDDTTFKKAIQAIEVRGSFTVGEDFGTTASPGGGLTVLRANDYTLGTGVCTSEDDDACAQVLFPAAGVLRYNSTVDLRVTGVHVDPSGLPDPRAWLYFDCDNADDTCPANDPIRIAGGTTGRAVEEDRAHRGSEWDGSAIVASSPVYANYTFIGASLAHAGRYYVTLDASGVDDADNTVAEFWVSPVADLAVTASPASFTYDPDGSFSSTLTVTTASGGSPVRLANVWSLPPLEDLPDETRSDGRVILFSEMPPVGTYRITAEKSVTADPEADVFGRTTIRVNPAALTMKSTATSAFRGFAQTVTFIPQLPGGTDPALLDDNLVNMEIRVKGPHPTATTGTMDLVYNGSATTGSLLGSLSCFDADNDEITDCEDADATSLLPLALSIDPDTGEVSFQPVAWKAGTYTFSVGLSTTDTATACDDLLGHELDTEDCEGWIHTPEYTGTLTLSPSAPADVNVEMVDAAADFCGIGDATGDEVVCPNAADTLDVLMATDEPAPSGYTLTIRVSGTTEWEHPLCRIRDGDITNGLHVSDADGACDPLGETLGFTSILDDDLNVVGVECPANAACDPAGSASPKLTTSGRTAVRSLFEIIETADFLADNVTVRGDVLDGWDATAYDPDTGEITIENVIPTKNGTAFIDIEWKGRTTTLTIPIARGAVVTANVTNVTVDSTTSVRVHVTDAFGTPQSTASVRIFQRDGGEYEGDNSPQVIAGTGASGRGLGGDYVFTLAPTTIQDLVIYAEIGSGLAQNFSYLPLDVVPARDLRVNLSTTNAMAANTTHVLLNITNGTSAAVAGSGVEYVVYFLDEDQTEDLLNNGTSSLFDDDAPDAIALGDEDDAGVHLNVSLDAGTYNVYVCSDFETGCIDARHDNRLNMETFTVHAYSVSFSPATISAGADIESDVAVNITVTDRNGAPATGTLRVFADDNEAGEELLESAPEEISVEDGKAEATLTGALVGNVRFEFNPEGDTPPGMVEWALVNGTLGVVSGNITFTPTSVTIGSTTVVTVTLKDLAGAALPARNVWLCSPSLNNDFELDDDGALPRALDAAQEEACTARDTSTAQGVAGVTVTPTSLSPIGIYINGTYSGVSIPVVAGRLTVVVNPAAPARDGTATITVTQPGGSPAGGTTVVVMRDGSAITGLPATDSEGNIVLTNLQAGNYTVTATRQGFLNGTASFTVGGGNATPPSTTARFELSNLQVPATATVGQGITVSADVANTGQAAGTATVLLLVNGSVRDTRSVPVNPDEKETLSFDFVPREAGSFKVTVRLSTGETLAERTVTISTPTTTTTTTTATTPPTTTTGATTTTTTPTPKVPGFEVVALLGALAVAMLVLRRRN